MADIRPFRAVRPLPELTAEIASPPYDVVSTEEACAYVKAHPKAFLGLDIPEIAAADDLDALPEKVRAGFHAGERELEAAREKLEESIASPGQEGPGTLYVQDERAAYYLYEQTFRGRTQTGIVACTSIDDYVNDVVKKHEKTLEKKERGRVAHVDILNAHTGPIFLCYRQRADLRRLIAQAKEREPLVCFEGWDGTQNRVFIADDEALVEAIRKAFAETEAVYIADGHHRCAAAVKVGLMRREHKTERKKPAEPDKEQTEILESGYFLSVLFADEELEIMDYNRVVKDLNGLSAEAFLERLRLDFEVTKADEGEDAKLLRPRKKGDFSMYLDGAWYRLSALESIRSDDAIEGLDVSLLQNRVLHPILGIGDPRTDSRIDFVGGIRGLSALEERCHQDARVAFALHPTSIGELFAVADAGLLMPPKSTWFEPKLLSGLFLHPFAREGVKRYEGDRR